jgi:dTDP-4-amino-4,6-dideoxygalactose transaminase
MDMTIFVPQTDPRAGYLAHKDELDSAVRDVLESGWYILGEEVETFEREFASYIGVAYAIGVASGTDALEIALRSFNVGQGDLVFTVSHSAVATVAAIGRAGATPVLVDIDQTSYTMDPNDLEVTIKAVNDGQLPIKGQPRVIIPVHLYGHPADMASIMSIARKYNLIVIEDCAQAHGAAITAKKVGSFSDMAAFSFYPTKNLGGFGDGGCVVTNGKEAYYKLSALRQYGWETRYISSIQGISSRLDELQAAILRVKLGYLDRDNNRRRQIAEAYTQVVSKTSIHTPKEMENATHVYHQYVVRTKEREKLIQHFNNHLIATAIHYPQPVHLQPAYKDSLPVRDGALAITEQVCKEILSLPMYAEMTDNQIERVLLAVSSWRQGD